MTFIEVSADVVKTEDTAHVSGDKGLMILGVRNDAPSSDFTSANGEYSPIATDAKGTVYTRERTNATSSVTSVALSTTTATILASNTLRRGATIYNDSTTDLYVKLGAVASATSFSIRLGAGGYYELPAWYSGVVDGVLISGTGNARVTEISA